MDQAIPSVTLENGLDLLENAAGTGDILAFAKAEDEIDWTGYLPENIIHAIHLAIAIGAFVSARHISERGAALNPHHDDLQRYARVLAPPKIIRTDLPADPSITADADWLKNTVRNTGAVGLRSEMESFYIGPI